MALAEFLSILILRLDNAGISHCVLRNYDGLPQRNSGNDIDLLISPHDLETVITILFGIEGVTITGILKRAYVASSFIRGVDWGEGCHAIQIDWVFLLGWKGIPYLSVSQVLADAQEVPGSGGLLKKPALYHEALISFFSSYLVGGWIKEKYQLMVREAFNQKKIEILSILCNLMPRYLAAALIVAVIEDNRKHLLVLLPKLKGQMLLRYLALHPFRSIRAIANHFFIELRIRYTSYPITTICFLGPDGSGKSSVIAGVVYKLKDTTKEIACYHLKPALIRKKARSKVVTDPHAKPPRSAIFSACKIMCWLLLYWIDRVFHGHKNLTIRIWDRYYYDLLIDPKRYRYGASMWFAGLVGKFIPKPDIVILLDAPSNVLQERKKEVPLKETARQKDAYLKYVLGLENGFVIDASKPLRMVFQDTEKAILRVLAQRAKRAVSDNYFFV